VTVANPVMGRPLLLCVTLVILLCVTLVLLLYVTLVLGVARVVGEADGLRVWVTERVRVTELVADIVP